MACALPVWHLFQSRMKTRSIIARALNRYGIDARQLKTLLGVYIKQDLRGGKAFMQFGAREYVRSNLALMAVVGMYLFFGFILGTIVFTAELDVFHYSIIVLTFTIFIVALAIVSESGNVIFNETEADVLGHLPLGPRTYFAAKVLNLFLFTLLLAASANLFPAITGIWTIGSNPLFILAHAISASLVALFATAIVVTSYGLLMRYVSKDRFDNIVTYSQVTLMLFFMFGFQILPRVLGTDSLSFAPGFHWYYLLYPPAWFSGTTLILIGHFELSSIALAMLAILSLMTLGAVAFRKVAGGYSSFVSQLAYSEGEAKAGSGRDESQPITHGLLQSIKSLLLYTPAERAVFELVSIYLRRNREIKVRLYPSLAYFIFFPLLAIFTEGLPDPFNHRSSGGYSLMGAVMICFVSLTAIEGLVFSEHFPAGYIYRVAPIKSLGQIHSGFRKAVLLWVALPGFGVLMALYSIIWQNPLHAILLLIPWIIMTPTVLMLPFLLRETLPLSRKYQKGQQTARNLSIAIFSMVALSIVAGIQIIAITGRVPLLDVGFPYWLFILLIIFMSALSHLALRALSGEMKPIRPSDADS
jgi:ABC-2 type transport system permease protein